MEELYKGNYIIISCYEPQVIEWDLKLNEDNTSRGQKDQIKWK
jgi:hypothetical protein